MLQRRLETYCTACRRKRRKDEGKTEVKFGNIMEVQQRLISFIFTERLIRYLVIHNNIFTCKQNWLRICNDETSGAPSGGVHMTILGTVVKYVLRSTMHLIWEALPSDTPGMEGSYSLSPHLLHCFPLNKKKKLHLIITNNLPPVPLLFLFCLVLWS